jgi:flagellar protein FliO/FliZ
MELAEISRFCFALAFVLGLIWLLAYLAKRFGLDKKFRGVTGQKGRMAVVDVLYLDPKRKLTLVRADTHEYLLLIAGDHAQLLDKKETSHETPKP